MIGKHQMHLDDEFNKRVDIGRNNISYYYF